MPVPPAFSELARHPSPRLDHLALALAAELRPVDAPGALARLDALGREAAEAAAGARGDPHGQLAALRAVLGERCGLRGPEPGVDRSSPDLSMLDLVLERRRGLPILLSVAWQEVARRAGIALAGVGLPGHFVVGHFGARPPALVDPDAGGVALPPALAPAGARPWGPHETAMRMLNNLVAAYTSGMDLGRAIRSAELRLELPASPEGRRTLDRELLALRARLN